MAFMGADSYPVRAFFFVESAMPNTDAETLIQSYYDAFNAKDVEGFLALLTDDVVHDINQGERETGKAAFRVFLERMNRCYEEKIVDLFVMTNADGSRAAAEFTVLGVYLESDEGLPPAEGQRYSLPAGAFFEIRDGKVARISNTYNLNDWIRQVGG
jgi:steroid delta-isomerase-like uncharacterized protein